MRKKWATHPPAFILFCAREQTALFANQNTKKIGKMQKKTFWFGGFAAIGMHEVLFTTEQK